VPKPRDHIITSPTHSSNISVLLPLPKPKHPTHHLAPSTISTDTQLTCSKGVLAVEGVSRCCVSNAASVCDSVAVILLGWDLQITRQLEKPGRGVRREE
jgi:hypothetical protein